MSEKRFELRGLGVFDTENDNKSLSRVDVVDLLNELSDENRQLQEIIKSQDMEISRQYNLCLAMSGVLREEFGVYDVFDRTKDRKIE